MMGKPIDKFTGDGSRLVDVIEQSRRNGSWLAEYGVELSWKDRSPTLVDLQAAPIHERPGEMLLLIHPRSIAEKMDRTLTHRGAARSVIGMAAMLAHEIKNPLAAISGAAQLLEMQAEENDRELAILIREEAARVEAIVDQVDQFGDVRPPAREPVNIHDILDQAKRAAAAGYASHVRFKEEFDPSLPMTVGDSTQLMQVIQNLLKNAAEAAPKAGGVISLSTAYRTGVKIAIGGGKRESLPLHVTITDNGPGVPEDLKQNIFDPFVTSKAKGTGLGLALVSKVVADHGGVVECESEPGKTSFRLLLPQWKEPKTPLLKRITKRTKETTS
jgi:two-component system nitrogen regulation sensor histidine kinase GlnL